MTVVPKHPKSTNHPKSGSWENLFNSVNKNKKSRKKICESQWAFSVNMAAF